MVGISAGQMPCYQRVTLGVCPIMIAAYMEDDDDVAAVAPVSRIQVV